MSITIKDIAKIAGVSHTTVSRALNNSPYINEETRKMILDIARRSNYVPNYSAKSLVRGRSYNIGLFFSTMGKGTSPEFFHNTVLGVNSIIKQHYNLLVRGIDDYSNYLCIDSKRFDGIILMSQSDSDDTFIQDVIGKNIPLVVLNREVKECSISNILADEKNGAYTAAEHLIKNGHRNIAIIKGREGFKSTADRLEGFLQALQDSKIDINNKYMVNGNYDIESGYIAMKELLNLPEVPTAVFCSNDDMAVGAMKAASEAGLNVPHDLSLIGFDNSDFCKYVTPTLTTIKKPVSEMSITGAKKMLNMIESGDNKKERIYISTGLVIRQSVASLK